QREAQNQAAGRVRQLQLQRLGLQPAAVEDTIHQEISTSRFQPTKEFVGAAEAWLRKLSAANQRAGIYPEPAFARVLGDRWYMVCRLSTVLGPWSWRAFRRSPLSKGTRVSAPRLVKFGLKCLLRSPAL